MSAVPGRPKPATVAPTWLALLAMLWPGTAQPALPPMMPKNDSGNALTPAVPSAGTNTADPLADDGWVMPAVRLRGLLTYDIRRDNAQARQGLTGTVTASTSTYIWQPWFATVNGNLGLTMLRHSGSGNAADSGNASGSGAVITGSGQLSVLQRSPYPFEAYFQRNDSRVSFDLALANDYASQTYGFTQRYVTPSFDALLGWERNSQTSTGNGYNQQDNLRLQLSHARQDQRLRLTGTRIDNTQQISGQQLVENHLSVTHSYTPDPSLSVDSMANVTRSAYQLQQGDTNTRLLQVNSTAFWRPAGQPMSVIGGVRVFALGTETTGGANASNAFAARGRSANANLGVNYEVNRFTRINAGANINLVQDNDGGKSLTTSQNLGGSYAPDAIEFGKFQYTWSTAVSANNQTGEDAARQLSLQLNHSLRRSYRLGDSSTIAVDGSQSVSTVFGGSTSGRETTASTRQLINNGSLSWDLSQQSGATQLRLSASDSRGLDGRQEYFQLVNFQASSNLQVGRFSSWTGNLTIQGIRQGSNSIFVNADPFNPQTDFAPESKFEITSHGSISYQNQRMFGVTHLRFTSDLRLNSQALLPLLGSAEDQKTAAWSNSVDYAIGRTQLRAQALLSTGSGPYSIAAPAADGAAVQKINKSILFTISRGFGND